MNLTRRPRRNRKSEVIRNLVQENFVTVNDLIFPIFVLEGQNQTVPITSMPGISRFSTDRMLDEIAACVDLGVKAFAPFPVISEAKKEASRDGAPPIDLMDGNDLAENLKELKLGIEVELVEKVHIKSDWFKTL